MAFVIRTIFDKKLLRFPSFRYDSSHIYATQRHQCILAAGAGPTNDVEELIVHFGTLNGHFLGHYMVQFFSSVYDA